MLFYTENHSYYEIRLQTKFMNPCKILGVGVVNSCQDQKSDLEPGTVYGKTPDEC